VRYGVALVLAVVALIYLASTALMLWKVGLGQMNVPHIYLWDAFYQVSFAIVAASGAVLFLFLLQPKRSRLANAICVACVATVVIAIALPRIAHFLSIDSCLDSGGRWEYSQESCER
jgi:hypothetical protein